MRLTLFQLLELALLVTTLVRTSTTTGLQAGLELNVQYQDAVVGPGNLDDTYDVPTSFQAQHEAGPSEGADQYGGTEEGHTELKDTSSSLYIRASPSLDADTPKPLGVNPGQSVSFVFPASIQPRSYKAREGDETSVNSGDSELRKRQGQAEASRNVYITINTCQQPDFEDASVALDPPQLSMTIRSAISLTPTNIGLLEGYANYTVATDEDVQISVQAPKVAISGGTWDFEIAASVEANYHSWMNHTTEAMVKIDSDAESALLITNGNITNFDPTWTSEDPLPFTIFLQNVNYTGSNGLRHSVCGMTRAGQIPGPDQNSGIDYRLSHYLLSTTAASTEQQIYVPKLNASSTYYGYLAKPSAVNVPTVGGGGTVYAAMNFTTKRFSNCRLIFGLDFCDTVAYSVPANPELFPNVDDLAALYDEDAANKYKGFDWSLQQIPCNTTDSAQYSLAKTCVDCAEAYKKWLCAVTIPRCSDWAPDPLAGTEKYAQPRNAAQVVLSSTPDIIRPVNNRTLMDWTATNGSRNGDLVNGKIKPGPYNEILPCYDLCHELVRSCPAALQFSCPTRQTGMNMSYHVREYDADGCLSCSEPGAFCQRSGAGSVSTQTSLVWAVVLLFGLLNT